MAINIVNCLFDILEEKLRTALCVGEKHGGRYIYIYIYIYIYMFTKHIPLFLHQ